MALDFKREGYEAGKAAASDARATIAYLKDSEKIALICGKRIAALLKSSDDWIVKHSVSYQVGFFNGFMDRAEQIAAAEQ